MLAKITQLHQLKETGSLRFLLEVDGSCNRNTYRALLGAGAQILVMGSSGLFRADMPLELASGNHVPRTVRRAALPRAGIEERMMSGKVCVFGSFNFDMVASGGSLSGTR